MLLWAHVSDFALGKRNEKFKLICYFLAFINTVNENDYASKTTFCLAKIDPLS